MKRAAKSICCVGVGGRDGAGELSPARCVMPQPQATRGRAR